MDQKTGTQLESFTHAFFAKKNLIQAKYGWKDDDARLTIFNKINRLLAAINIGYFLSYTYLRQKSWWKEHEAFGVDENGMRVAGDDFEMLLRIGMGVNLVSCVESSFRIFTKALNPSACSNGTAEFKSIYEFIFKQLGLQQLVTLLDLLRNIRNTIHNNGLFFPPKGQNQTVIYNGTVYHFEVGQLTHFVTTEFLIEILPDLLSLTEAVVEASPLKDIDHIREISPP